MVTADHPFPSWGCKEKPDVVWYVLHDKLKNLKFCAIPYKEEIFSTAKSRICEQLRSKSLQFLFKSENPTAAHFSTAESDPFVINF